MLLSSGLHVLCFRPVLAGWPGLVARRVPRKIWTLPRQLRSGPKVNQAIIHCNLEASRLPKQGFLRDTHFLYTHWWWLRQVVFKVSPDDSHLATFLCTHTRWIVLKCFVLIAAYVKYGITLNNSNFQRTNSPIFNVFVDQAQPMLIFFTLVHTLNCICNLNCKCKTITCLEPQPGMASSVTVEVW